MISEVELWFLGKLAEGLSARGSDLGYLDTVILTQRLPVSNPANQPQSLAETYATSRFFHWATSKLEASGIDMLEWTRRMAAALEAVYEVDSDRALWATKYGELVGSSTLFMVAIVGQWSGHYREGVLTALDIPPR